jgi:glucokinase
MRILDLRSSETEQVAQDIEVSEASSVLLAGDIGGTKTRLALFRREGARFLPVAVEFFPSQEAKAFPEILEKFCRQHPAQVDAACFGAPGPVFAGEVDPTNLDWNVREQDIRNTLGIARVKVVNDLVATAAAIPHLASDKLMTLHDGQPTQVPEERYVVLAPGTGLGQSFLIIRDGVPFIFPSEGGHVDFAPTSDMEIALLRYLLRRFPRVSYERVLSGPGTENIYEFLRDTIYRDEPPELVEKFQHDDRAKVISEAGLAGAYPIAVQTVEIFARVLGSYAGNLALTFRANRGVYLGGGIPPRMLSKFQDGSTVRAFLKKERMADLVAAIPLRVILDDHAALLGAAVIASTLSSPP